MKSEIKAAIARSAAHNEIVRVKVRNLANVPAVCEQVAEVADYVETDDMSSEARMIDIWGKTYDGDEFRIYCVADLGMGEDE